MNRTALDSILEHYRRNPGQIIAILHEIQDDERYLPEEDLRYLAQELSIPTSQIFHISTFYKAFSLKPKGKHICNVCMGTACHVRGAPRVLEEFERQLGIKCGGTTEDKLFSVDTVNCVGACALGPVVTVDGEYYGNMNTAAISKLIRKISSKAQNTVEPKSDESEA
jgi:NADH-quinone oxidoreductase subunit E